MDLHALNNFLGNASVATYAGGGKRLITEKKGFFDLEYREGGFYYRDSFAGYLASFGQEVVWYQDKPVWMCSYGGGMKNSKANDAQFAHTTFGFLKRALRTGDKNKNFQPRGPENLKDGDWEYMNKCEGDISEFKGHEEIHYKGELVFVHDYFGGIVKDGRS
jgi:hypothetical protein